MIVTDEKRVIEASILPYSCALSLIYVCAFLSLVIYWVRKARD